SCTRGWTVATCSSKQLSSSPVGSTNVQKGYRMPTSRGSSRATRIRARAFSRSQARISTQTCSRLGWRAAGKHRLLILLLGAQVAHVVRDLVGSPPSQLVTHVGEG